MSRWLPLAASVVFALSAFPAGAQTTQGTADAVPADHAGADGPVTVLAAQRDRHERLTVPVMINGAGPFRFLVDTGAQATVVTTRVTEALGLLPSGQATLVGMASRTAVETVALDGLEFAGRRFNALTTALLRGSDIGADGIIGLDSLQDLRVVLDFRADTIQVEDAPGSRAPGYDIVVRARRKLGQMIITDARIDGVQIAVVIDTGSWDSIGNGALRSRLRLRSGETFTSVDVTGTALTSTVAIAGKLSIGSMTLAGVPIGFTESPAFAAIGLADRPALILGIGNLRPFDRVAIDFGSGKVLFDVPRDGDAARF